MSLSEFERDFIEKSRRINDFCLRFGCFFELQNIRNFELLRIDTYVSDSKRTTDSNEDIYKVINAWSTAVGYHPLAQAWFIYRAQETPHFREISHHLERGLINYYRGDFFSAVSVLIPAVEGVLRRYLGASPRVIGKQLVDKLDVTTFPIPAIHAHLTARHAMFLGFLRTFLRRWFFVDTAAPHINDIPSAMTRNYVAHLLGERSFYDPADCNRLFAFFNILLEVITLEDSSLSRFIGMMHPECDERVKRRTHYYSGMILPDSPWRTVRHNDEKFLGENANYVPSEIPNWVALMFELEEELTRHQKRIREGYLDDPPGPPLPPGYSSPGP